MNIRRIFIHFFDKIFVNFDQIFVNSAKICLLKLLTVVLRILSQNTEEDCWIGRSNFFWLKFVLNLSKFGVFVKNGTKFAFSPLALSLLKRDTLKLQANFCWAQERASCTPAGFEYLLENNLANFLPIQGRYLYKMHYLLLTNWKLLYRIDQFSNHFNKWLFFRRTATSGLVLISLWVRTTKIF